MLPKFKGKGSKRQKSECQKSKKEHRKSKKNIKNQNVEGSERRKFFWMIRTLKVKRSEHQKSLRRKER